MKSKVDNWMLHDSQDVSYRKPFGAVATNQKITLHLKVMAAEEINHVRLHLTKELNETTKQVIELDELKEHESYKFYQITIESPDASGLLWYFFEVVKNGDTFYYGNNHERLGGVGQIYSDQPISFQITIYQNQYKPPRWFQGGLVYQIFVDRFYNGNQGGQVLASKKRSLIHSDWTNDPVYIKDDEGNIVYWDFFGGNLLGVKKKLGYLKELGVTAIYLNPIFEASSNHKYDTADYLKIDPMFGTNDDFRKLCTEAAGLGIAIILDGVFSHTGSDSIYFNKEGSYPSLGAYQSKDSLYYSWYRFEEYPTKYESWWGIEVLPNVNELESSYLDFIITGDNSVIKHWQRLGAKGWRLDVADELPDQFIQSLKKTMKAENEDTVLIGEVWEDASNKISYEERRRYFTDDELDSVMNYPFRLNVIDFIFGRQDSERTHRSLMSLYENYPKHHFYSLLNIIGTHDTKRILTILRKSCLRN